MGFGKRLLESPPTTKVIIGSNLLGSVLLTIGLFTMFWLKLDDTGKQGLWYFCSVSNSSIYECCATLQDYVNNTKQTIPAFLLATRAFMVMGFISMLITNITFFVPLGKPSLVGRRSFAILLKVVHFLTGINIAIAVSIYGADYTNHNLTKFYHLHASFGLCVAASFFFIVSGIILICVDISDDLDD